MVTFPFLIHQTFFTACSPLRIILTVSKVDNEICIILAVAKVDFLFGVVFRRNKVPQALVVGRVIFR